MDKYEQYILDELAYSAGRQTWFEINGNLAIKLQEMMTRKDAEIERLREQERKMTNHALDRMEEIERLRKVVTLLIEYEEHDENIYKGAVMWEALIEAAHRALESKES